MGKNQKCTTKSTVAAGLSNIHNFLIPQDSPLKTNSDLSYACFTDGFPETIYRCVRKLIYFQPKNL